MSHQNERTDKICLNCGTEVAGRFCQVCGQENVEIKESFWHLVTHFFNDITHFDGKFFTTVGLLLRKPGMLSAEYMKGRRMKYLNPIRMYVFTSFVFFLIFFNLFSVDKWDTGTNDSQNSDSANLSRNEMRDSILSEIRRDSVLTDNNNNLNFNINKSYSSIREFDSIQATLPQNEREGWLGRQLIHRKIKSSGQSGGEQAWIKNLLNKFLHLLPYLLFVSLPLFALFLKLLYFRKKDYYFADHAIFLIHLYIFTFIFILITLGLSKLGEYLNSSIFDWIIGIFTMYGLYYAFVGMKRFYKQGWGKTLLKFTLFNIMCTIALAFLFLLFLGISFFQV
ncbi:MAG: DUF3667 domain-containing protein [Flavitalea sp.]